MTFQVFMVIMALVSAATQQKAQSQQRKHQQKIANAQARKAEQDRKRAIRDERGALKKRQASMRAKMGAGGTGFGGGSSNAVLSGMQKQTTQNLLDINQGHSMNKELNKLSASDGVSSGLKTFQTVTSTVKNVANAAGEESFNKAFGPSAEKE